MACPAVSVASSWSVRLELRVQTGPAGKSMTMLESSRRASTAAEFPLVPDCHSAAPLLLEMTRLPSVCMVTRSLLPVP